MQSPSPQTRPGQRPVALCPQGPLTPLGARAHLCQKFLCLMRKTWSWAGLSLHHTPPLAPRVVLAQLLLPPPPACPQDASECPGGSALRLLSICTWQLHHTEPHWSFPGLLLEELWGQSHEQDQLTCEGHRVDRRTAVWGEAGAAQPQGPPS